jgi:hypothetical protein
MNVRDKLNTLEGYQEIIDRQSKYITGEFAKIKKLEEADKKGVQLFELPNQEVIQNRRGIILKYRYDNFVAKYSMGMNIKDLMLEIPSIIESMNYCWKKNGGYINMIWMLSIGIMLEIDDDKFSKLVEIVKRDDPQDYLYDLLIHYRIPSWGIKSDKVFSKVPYQAVREIVSLSKTDKTKGLERLKKYLSREWYRGHSSIGWHDTHKSQWNIHSGYWSFESGALVKILGLDDSSLKDTQYYPYDMVHWEDEKPSPRVHSWIIPKEKNTIMGYSVYAYLTDAKKVSSIYGSKDQSVLNELLASLKEDLEDLDNSFPDEINPHKNAAEVLKDIVSGKVSFRDIPFMYGYVYEKICEYFGKQIYVAENIWELEEQSAFIPIPFSDDFPYIISIEKTQLKDKKRKFCSLQEGEGIGDSDYEEEMEDLKYIMDEAIEQNMDLLICVY